MRPALLIAGIAMVYLAAAGPALAAASTAAQAVSPQPRATGTMYDGNNAKPPPLKLQDPMAPIIEAMERLESFSPVASESTSQATAGLGGNSPTARSGGGG